nr:winged helix-turn-helix domain-containing protein [Micromonospora radicis]
MTITVDLASGAGNPRLARLLELLGELAESGDGRLLLSESGDGGPLSPESGDGGPLSSDGVVRPSVEEDPSGVRILTGPRTVRHGDRVVPLTRIEYDLLLFLAERPRRVFTRLQLLNSVWGYDHAVARTVDVHVRRLRAKLGDGTPLLTTVHGVGYRLADDARVIIER